MKRSVYPLNEKESINSDEMMSDYEFSVKLIFEHKKFDFEEENPAAFWPDLFLS
jgi:hypothetical protein